MKRPNKIPAGEFGSLYPDIKSFLVAFALPMLAVVLSAALLALASSADSVALRRSLSIISALALVISAGTAILSSRQAGLRKRELAAAMGELSRVRERLLKTERSAVLGSALAGLAHELNTPIGVALTSASFVRDLAAPFAIENSKDPLRALAEIRKASDILGSSLKRASAVVASFRRVATEGGEESRTVLELGQSIEDAVNILSGPLADIDAHPVFIRDVPAYVRASYAAVNRTVASIVAGAAALPSQLGPKLFQVLVSGIDAKAFVEFSVKPLPAMEYGASTAAFIKRQSESAMETGIIGTLVEKDLGARADVRASADGGFTVTISMDIAKAL